MVKRRFGIAIPVDMARELDVVSGEFNTDRSKVVEHALRGFLKEFRHYSRLHRCTGILVIIGGGSKLDEDVTSYRDFRDIIVSYSHHHIEDKCIEVLILNGNSEAVAELHRRLIKAGYECRYIPLHDE